MTSWVFAPLSFRSPIAAYEAQARELLCAQQAGEETALEFVHRKHPRFLDDVVKWLPRRLTRAELAAATFDFEDAKLAVARGHDFADWHALAEHAEALVRRGGIAPAAAGATWPLHPKVADDYRGAGGPCSRNRKRSLYSSRSLCQR